MSNKDRARGRLFYRRLILAAAASLAGIGAMMASPVAAYAATGTASTSVTGGSLSVGTVVAMTALAPAIGGSAAGALPSAQWADDTGTGNGWNGTVATSPLTYTGTWVAGLNGGLASTALTSSATGAYTDTLDGVSYTVRVTTVTLGVVTAFTYTSTDTNDASGSSSTTATSGTTYAVGTKGLSITFNSATGAVGDTYTVLAGTQSATGLQVHTASGTTISSSGTTSTAPVYVNNASVIPPGATVGTVNSLGAVKVLDAALGTGSSGTGYYVAAPGVLISADSNSWAKTYTANLVYTIVSGP